MQRQSARSDSCEAASLDGAPAPQGPSASDGSRFQAILDRKNRPTQCRSGRPRKWLATAAVALAWPPVLLGYTTASHGQATEPASDAPSAAEVPLPQIQDGDLLPPPPASRMISSWDEALTLIRTQAPVYATEYANIARAEAQARAALSGLLPNLSGQAAYAHEFFTRTLSLAAGTVTVPPQDVLTTTGTAAWSVLNPRAFYALGTANSAIESARLSFSEARRQIAVRVVGTMLGTLAAGRIAELNRVGLRAALERLVLTQTKVEFRQGTALDVDRAQQDVASARAQLIQGDESLKQAREALGLALGSAVPVAAPGDLDLLGFERAVASTCRIHDDLERRADVAAARVRLDLAQRAVTAAKLQFVPDIVLQSQATHSSRVTFGPQTTWNIVATLRVPLFDATRFATLADAKASVIQAEQALKSARLNAIIDVEQAERAVMVMARLRAVAEQQRELAYRIDRRTREGYTHGLGTSLDLVTSAQALRQADINLVLQTFQAAQARTQAVLATAECAF